MYKYLIILLLLIGCKKKDQYFFKENESWTLMQEGFINPPASARPYVYHWWLGGNVDTVRLKKELVALKDAGIAGFTIFEIGSRDTEFVKPGPPFLGDESLKTLKYAIELAGDLDMDVGLNTASSWNAGGSWVTPEHAAKSIYYSKTDYKDGISKRIKLPFPEIPEKDPWGRQSVIEFGPDGKPSFYREIAVLALPVEYGQTYLDTSQIIDVSGFFNSSTEALDWQAPEGDWQILRFVCSNSGEKLVLPSLYSAGPIIDHYDAEATEFHFMYIINKLQSVIGDLKNSALKSLYMASYEAKGFTWTTTLPVVFLEINGYNINKFLPALFDYKYSPDLYGTFRADFQRTLSELMINNFYKRSREICNRFGLKNNSEAGGPGLPLHNVPVEPLKALGALDIPRGEFWINHGRFNDEGIDILRVVKEVSAASHIYDRDIVEMEAFTTFQHWQEGPFEMKPAGDRAFCEGMNKVVFHGSTHNPAGTGFPGIVYHAGTHYNDKRVWWPKIKPFNEYLSRISFILQEADFKADVLFYYGDTIPNYGGHKNSRFSPGPGYEYEIINTEILKKLSVQNGKLFLPTGAQFSLLVLTDQYEINPEVLMKLKELSGQGAVIIGRKPATIAKRKPHPVIDDPDQILDDLWLDYRNNAIKKGVHGIFTSADARNILKDMGTEPDFIYPGEEFYTLDYTNYEKDGLDFYFIRNTREEWISRECSFRQEGKIPEIWDPVSGEIISVPIYERKGDLIKLPLSFPPFGSTFVVFRHGEYSPLYTQVKSNGINPPLLLYTADGILLGEEGEFKFYNEDKVEIITGKFDKKTLEGPWEVFFPEGWGAPEKTIFSELISWTQSDDPGIKYFSGTARYEKSFVCDIATTYSNCQKIFLDIGDLSNIGEAWLNGESLGITWTKPHRFDITDIIKPGINKLTVEVANTWSNRLTGDALTGENYTNTNISGSDVKELYMTRLPWREVPLIPAGLFGPVRILTLAPVNKITGTNK